MARLSGSNTAASSASSDTERVSRKNIATTMLRMQMSPMTASCGTAKATKVP